MFTGTWKESQESLIKLEIPDENIDEEGKIVQPCFYESRFIHNLSEFSESKYRFLCTAWNDKAKFNVSYTNALTPNSVWPIIGIGPIFALSVDKLSISVVLFICRLCETDNGRNSHCRNYIHRALMHVQGLVSGHFLWKELKTKYN